MRERIVIVFIAIAIGLLVTTLVFFLYQQTKTIPKESNIISGGAPSETPSSSPYLTIDSPPDENISDRRLIQIKGKTNPENTLVVSTNQEDVAALPTSDGKFSVSITIDAGANIIVTRAIAPSGEETVDRRVITFSTEEF